MDVIKVFYYFRGTSNSRAAERLIKKLEKVTKTANKEGWHGTTLSHLYYAEADKAAINACREDTTLAQMLIRFGKNIGDE